MRKIQMKCQINVKLICQFVKPGKRTEWEGERSTDRRAERKAERRAERKAERRAESKQRGKRRASTLWPIRRQSMRMRIEASSLNASQFAIN